MSRAAQHIQEALAKADIHLNGTRPWDIRVNDPKLYRDVYFGGIQAIGDGYVLGRWECDAIDQLVDKAYSAGLAKTVSRHPFWILHGLRGALSNMGRRDGRATEVKRHYDAGNDLFEAMLDPRMIYTSGYWKGVSNLEEAQTNKLELICKKIGLKKGMRVLDIGGGWGGFVKYAAQRHGAHGTSVTISKEQKAYADASCAGLDVETLLMDYRDISGDFDAVVSIEMVEAVGHKNYRDFMRVASDRLPEGGIFLLQAIIGNHSTTHTNPWIDNRIFPGGMLPSLAQLSAAAEGLFVVEDIHVFGTDYDKTLMAWFKNFTRNWPSLEKSYDETFYRMWKLYLLSCAGAFRARNMQVCQIVFSKGGIRGGYETVR